MLALSSSVYSRVLVSAEIILCSFPAHLPPGGPSSQHVHQPPPSARSFTTNAFCLRPGVPRDKYGFDLTSAKVRVCEKSLASRPRSAEKCISKACSRSKFSLSCTYLEFAHQRGPKTGIVILFNKKKMLFDHMLVATLLRPS
jgi:hypothetical protein